MSCKVRNYRTPNWANFYNMKCMQGTSVALSYILCKNCQIFGPMFSWLSTGFYGGLEWTSIFFFFFLRNLFFSFAISCFHPWLFFYPPLLFSPRMLRLRGLTYTVTEQAAYHPAIRGVKTILMNNWFGIAKPAVTENHQHTKPPIISYKRGKSLKDTLVGAKI